ncbi:tRNA modification GTPase [Silvibacterium bohemicum]|uniref:tRNA modification GTPase MnmE n=1 Tax=Silvibacterium bohemicum TaxID=1577686 RepID=A0A841JX27_9BACT|nr:tRNA uridine-5-carboxymethylaminomethyl(34) synthesis GTPase MnmE [Silvibacterium bohemicum]MBB6145710.1 tRNA modification GTPase [Silvibacterium bohemicum]
MQPHPQVAEQESIAHETIVAISTPPGRGGIGIVRLSGPHALEIANALLTLRSPLAHALARFAEIHDPESNSKLDEAIATWFAKPKSYTGEDLIEIAAHGSPVILELLVRLALQHGARLARPGEFTERAFLSGRIDLTQAEAVRDLIESQTLYQARTAAEQMDGALSRRIRPVKQTLVELIAVLEAGIDFAEDDVDLMPDAEIVTRIDTISVDLEKLARSFEHGRIVHSGLTMAIVGRPNVGKSSLFNRLVERERAIVTATPGTTRDLVTERVSLGGIPLELVDTAGLRESTDEAESIGIQKSREALADADLVLVVIEAGVPLREDEAQIIQSLAGRKALIVRNKIDLDLEDNAVGESTMAVVGTSARTGQGIDDLRAALLSMVRAPTGESESGILTNLRQHQAVTEALSGLVAAEEAVARKTPHEMLLLDLYSTLRQLDSLTGETTADDILNRIFSTFCIGK